MQNRNKNFFFWNKNFKICIPMTHRKSLNNPFVYFFTKHISNISLSLNILENVIFR